MQRLKSLPVLTTRKVGQSAGQHRRGGGPPITLVFLYILSLMTLMLHCTIPSSNLARKMHTSNTFHRLLTLHSSLGSAVPTTGKYPPSNDRPGVPPVVATKSQPESALITAARLLQRNAVPEVQHLRNFYFKVHLIKMMSIMHPNLLDDEESDDYEYLQQSRESWTKLIARCENDPAICEVVGTWMCYGAGFDSYEQCSKPDFSLSSINQNDFIEEFIVLWRRFPLTIGVEPPPCFHQQVDA